MATARHALRLITFHIAFCAGFVPRDAAVRAVVERAAAALVAAAAVAGAPPAARADGYDAVLALCPDDRLTCVSSLDPSHFLEPFEYDDDDDRPPEPARGNVPEESRASSARAGTTTRSPRAPRAPCAAPSARSAGRSSARRRRRAASR